MGGLIPTRAFHRWRNHARCACIAVVFLSAAGACDLIVDGEAWAQTPKRSIGINPDHPSPDAQTPMGIDVSSTALVENANAWNGRVISFTGEAIGEHMVRGRMAWIHVNDDAYMEKSIEAGAGCEGYNSGQAIWLPSELAYRIQFFGDHHHQGDLVNVIGTFNAVCAQHGGDMDIHATELTVVAAGHPVAHPFQTKRAALAAILMLVSGLLYWKLRLLRSKRL